MVALAHDGGGRERRDRRLADRHHMRARAELAEEVDEMISVVVEPEAALAARNVARIVPVGDVDVVVLEQRLHGAAQQRREMAGHRRHQQHARLLGHALLLEVQQRAERGCVGDLLGDGDLTVAYHDAVDAVGRAMVGEGGARDQLQRRRQPADDLVRHALRHQIEELERRRGARAPRRRQVHLVLKGLIIHRHHTEAPTCPMVPCNIEAKTESNRP
ncbi:hypothetical protein ACVI1J_002156 [Bradyrhizobium diazoefficiens]